MRIVKKRRILAAALIAVMVSVFLPASVFADDAAKTVTLSIPMELALDEAAAAKDKVYTFELTGESFIAETPDSIKYALAEDEAAGLLPSDGTVITMTEAGSVEIGTFTYTEAGTYTYKLEQTTEDEKGFTLDRTVYTITVYVLYDDADDLIAPPSVTINDASANKPMGLKFMNSYKEPPVVEPPKGDPEPPKDPPKEEPPKDPPKDPPKVEPPKEEPTPKLPSILTQIVRTVTKSVRDAEVIEEEPVPLAKPTGPDTGDASTPLLWLVLTVGAVGTLFYAGSKKRDADED